jgi:hypothetical protein
MNKVASINGVNFSLRGSAYIVDNDDSIEVRQAANLDDQWGVNWSCMGTRSVFDAIAYSTRLMAAATLAAQMNYTASVTAK